MVVSEAVGGGGVENREWRMVVVGSSGECASSGAIDATACGVKYDQACCTVRKSVRGEANEAVENGFEEFGKWEVEMVARWIGSGHERLVSCRGAWMGGVPCIPCRSTCATRLRGSGGWSDRCPAQTVNFYGADGSEHLQYVVQAIWYVVPANA